MAERKGWFRIQRKHVPYINRWTPAEKSVYFALMAHADSEGRCYPGFAKLKESTGLHENSIGVAIALLESREVIEVFRTPHKVNHYRILYL
jgi:hypothetical protein